MTPHRALNLALTAALALLIAGILSTGYHLDDHSEDWASSQALADAQRTAQLAARTEKSAQALCQRVKGPNAGYRWTPAGELVCTSNKGTGGVSVAKVAL